MTRRASPTHTAAAGREDDERLTLLGRPLPAGLCLRLVVLDPEAERPYRSGEWRGGLVVVERGAIVLVAHHGPARPLACGAVLWLAGLPLRALANPHPDPALLSVLSRREASGGQEA